MGPVLPPTCGPSRRKPHGGSVARLGRSLGVRWRPLLAAACLAALLALPMAAAHADLVSSEPAQGAMLDAAPERVQVTLSEPVDPAGSFLHVIDASHRRVDLDDLRSTGGSRPTLSVGLPGDLPPGAYRLHWRGLSTTDGHPTEGTVGFAIGGHTPPPSTTDRMSAPLGQTVARVLSYAGFSLAFGALAFLVWMQGAGFPPAWARVALAAGTTLHLSGAVLLLANTVAAGLGSSQLASSEVGQVLLLRVTLGAAAWVLSLVWLGRTFLAGPFVVGTLLLGSGLGSARLGHAYDQGYAFAAIDFIHLVSAATWVGGLALFLLLLSRAPALGLSADQVRLAGIRFGTVALVSVTLLGLSGLVVAVAVLGPANLARPWDLPGTPYGAYLGGKVLLTAAMLGLAALNRYVFLAPPKGSATPGPATGPPPDPAAANLLGGPASPAAAPPAATPPAATPTAAPTAAAPATPAPGDRARRQLRRSVAVEATMGVAILVLAGLLTSVAPPAQGGDAEVLSVQGQGRHHDVDLAVDPAPQANVSSTLRIAIRDHDTGPLAGDDCGRDTSCVGLSMVYDGVGAPETYVTTFRDGAWEARPVLWAQPGGVTVTVTISTAAHYEDTVTLRLQVAP